MDKDIILQVNDLKVSYGKIAAVKGISFQLKKGEIVSLIGANGAGKTTTLKAISGLLNYSGDVVYNGMNLRKVVAHNIAALGIAHVPEGRGIFWNLSAKKKKSGAVSTAAICIRGRPPRTNARPASNPGDILNSWERTGRELPCLANSFEMITIELI